MFPELSTVSWVTVVMAVCTLSCTILCLEWTWSQGIHVGEMSKEETEQTRCLDADRRRWDLAEPDLTLLVKGRRSQWFPCNGSDSWNKEYNDHKWKARSGLVSCVSPNGFRVFCITRRTPFFVDFFCQDRRHWYWKLCSIHTLLLGTIGTSSSCVFFLGAEVVASERNKHLIACTYMIEGHLKRYSLNCTIPGHFCGSTESSSCL